MHLVKSWQTVDEESKKTDRKNIKYAHAQAKMDNSGLLESQRQIQMPWLQRRGGGGVAGGMHTDLAEVTVEPLVRFQAGHLRKAAAAAGAQAELACRATRERRSAVHAACALLLGNCCFACLLLLRRIQFHVHPHGHFDRVFYRLFYNNTRKLVFKMCFSH